MVLHKNKWDRKATKAHERKLRAKAEASGTTGGVTAGGGAKTDTSRKVAGVGSKPTDPAVGGNNEGKGEGGVVEVESEGGAGDRENKDGQEGEEGEEEEEDEEKGKYSRRKIVDNSWRYEEPEEDPYLKAQEEEDQEPEPDYVRMTVGKAQLKDSSDEEEEEDVDDPESRRALDEILIRDMPASKDLPAKGKIIQVDRRHFQDIDEKVAKQKAADAFRQRFARKSKAKAHPPGSHPTIDFDDNDDDTADNIDEFLGELKLEARTPAQRSLEKTRMPIAGGTGKDSRSEEEEEDDKWLDEMLGSRPPVAKGKSYR